MPELRHVHILRPSALGSSLLFASNQFPELPYSKLVDFELSFLFA
jgi:hypothetical protein